MTQSVYPKPKRKNFMGLRRSALAEIIIALAALLAFDAVFLDHTRYWLANPHPFWFVVLFIACKYGTKEALVAALACSVALLAGHMPAQAIDQDGYAYLFMLLRLPLLWLVSAVIFGELRQMHIHERDRLETSLQESATRENAIADAYAWVRDVKDRLELQIAGQMRSALSAYHAAKTMENLNPVELLKGLEALVEATLHPQQFSIYSLDKDGLTCILTHGWEGERYQRHFAPDSALYQAIAGRRQRLCVADAAQEALLAAQGILAGPLLDSKSGEVIGMLKIERMDFVDLHVSNIETFGTICEWGGMAILNARKFQISKAGSIVNPDHHLLTAGYFKRYTAYMASLARRVGFDVTMLAVRTDRPEQFDADTRLRIARALGKAVDSVLRQIDLAFDHQDSGDEYSIVLPATNRAGAEIVQEKIRAALTGLPEGAQVTFILQTLYEKTSA